MQKMQKMLFILLKLLFSQLMLYQNIIHLIKTFNNSCDISNRLYTFLFLHFFYLIFILFG